MIVSTVAIARTANPSRSDQSCNMPLRRKRKARKIDKKFYKTLIVARYYVSLFVNDVDRHVLMEWVQRSVTTINGYIKEHFSLSPALMVMEIERKSLIKKKKNQLPIKNYLLKMWLSVWVLQKKLTYNRHGGNCFLWREFHPCTRKLLRIIRAGLHVQSYDTNFLSHLMLSLIQFTTLQWNDWAE